MSTNKQSAPTSKPIQAVAKTATKGFKKSKIKAAFESMSVIAADSDKAQQAKSDAAVHVLTFASDFADANDGVDNETIVTAWRDNMKLLAMELAVAGNRFAELTEGKGDTPPTAKLTGYGNNVASIAKGVIQFEVPLTDDNGNKSYREVRKEVEGLRAEAKRESNPEAAKLADAKLACDEAWTALRKLVFDTGDTLNIESLTKVLEGHASDVTAQLIEQADLDAEVAAIEQEVIAA